MGMLVLTTCFTISLVTVYIRLNDRITSLTSAEVAVYNITNYNYTSGNDGGNMTIQLLNMTAVQDEILDIREELLKQSEELEELQAYVKEEMGLAYKELNSTVNKVQEDVNQQVQLVNDNVSNQNSLMAYQFAGTFAILGSLISFWHMMSHIRKLNNYIVQRKIIAILWMIPIYSVTSWLGLVIVDAQEYLALIKDFYEAYCIYTFLSFLISVLGGEDGDRDKVIDVLAKHADHLKPPIRIFNCFRKEQTFHSAKHKAEAVLDQCQLFAMQFVFLRPITSIAIVISDSIVRSRWDYQHPQFYIMMIANISIFFAFTGLLRFYHVVANDLNWMHPFSKFLCIKGVVFMTFWQGIVISFIAHAVYMDADANGSAEEFDETLWSVQAQSFLICLEMFFFAIAHCFTFPPEEWEPGYREREQRRIKAKFGDTLALRDFVKDVKFVMRRRKEVKEESESARKKKKAEKKEIKKRKKMKKERGGLTDMEMTHNLVNGISFEEEDDGDEEEATDPDPDVNWSDGWGRIEKYIDIVDSADLSSKSKSDDGDAEDDISYDNDDDGVELGDLKFKIDDDDEEPSLQLNAHEGKEIV
jgi:hypothetical protein